MSHHGRVGAAALRCERGGLGGSTAGTAGPTCGGGPAPGTTPSAGAIGTVATAGEPVGAGLARGAASTVAPALAAGGSGTVPSPAETRVAAAEELLEPSLGRASSTVMLSCPPRAFARSTSWPAACSSGT